MEISYGFVTTDEERRDVYRFRYEIYIEKMGFNYECDHENKLLHDNGATPILLFARLDDKVIGTATLHLGSEVEANSEESITYGLDRFLSVADGKDSIFLTRLITDEEYKKEGVAMALLNLVFDFLLKKEIKLIFLDCRPHLLNLYKSLGFRTYKETFNDQYAGILIPMVLDVQNANYLKAIKSPFSKFFEDVSPEDSSESIDLDELFPEANQVLTLTKGDTDVWAQFHDRKVLKVFDGFSESEKEELLNRTSLINCKTGDLLINKGGPDNTMFIIIEGSVDISVKGAVVATETKGGIVGEISFLLHTTRSATVTVNSNDTKILAIRQRALDQLIESESKLASRFLYNLNRIIAAKLAAVGGLF